MTSSIAETHVADWLTGIEESFAAAAGAELIEQQIVLTGEPVLLQFAGTPMFERLAPGFAHLVDASRARPALTLRIWDSAGASAEPPLPKVPEGPRGAVYYSADGAVQVAYQPGLQLLSALDRGAAARVVLVRERGGASLLGIVGAVPADPSLVAGVAEHAPTARRSSRKA